MIPPASIGSDHTARHSPLGALLSSATKSTDPGAVAGKVSQTKKLKCVRADHRRGRDVSHKLHAGANATKAERSRKAGSAKVKGAARKQSSCTPVHKTKPQSTSTLSFQLVAVPSHNDGAVGLPKPPSPKPKPKPKPTLESGVWGGLPFTNPFNPAELQFYASLVKNINLPPHYLVPIYKAAARRYHLPWQLLAAINREETDYGKDLNVSSAGAVGWMQFMPGTWETYGLALNRHNKVVKDVLPNPYNPRDAIFSAARYLRHAAAWRSVPRAVFAYNHADWYVVQVLSIAEQINEHGLKWHSSGHRKIAVMRTEARLLNGMPYLWGGGHKNWSVSTGGYDCSGFVSSVLHSVGFLKSPVTTQTLPFARGILLGKGRWVTIYDRTDGGASDADHVIINIKRNWWESGGSGLDGGADRVHRIKRKDLSKGYLKSFNLVLHPYGL
jgi:transglycosylase-like protein with SLT domain